MERIWTFIRVAVGLALLAFILTFAVADSWIPVHLDWTVSYYNSPEEFEARPLFVDKMPYIDCNWLKGCPHPGVPYDFAAEWETRILEPGKYEVTFAADDGIRAYFGDAQLFNQWKKAVDSNNIGRVQFWVREEDVGKALRIQFYDEEGNAMINVQVYRRVGWKRALTRWLPDA